MDGILVARDLAKRYGPFQALHQVSFSLRVGEVVGFLGPNGAGKSTTMKILTGFLPPTSGRAKIGGFDIFESPLEAKRRIGYLPETPPLYPEMSVRGYLAFVARLKGLGGAQVKREIDRVCQAVGLVPEIDRLILNLSKGYRQRVGLAQALLGDPPLLILDEPTEGLDPKQRQEVLGMIKGLGGKHTVILSTHILPEVKAICKKVLIIHRGKIVAHDTIGAAAFEKGLDETFIRLTAE